MYANFGPESGHNNGGIEPGDQEDTYGADGYPLYPQIGEPRPLGDPSTRIGEPTSPIDGLEKPSPQWLADPHVIDPNLVWGDEGRFNEQKNNGGGQ